MAKRYFLVICAISSIAFFYYLMCKSWPPDDHSIRKPFFNSRATELSFKKLKVGMSFDEVVSILAFPNAHDFMDYDFEVYGDWILQAVLKKMIVSNEYKGWIGDRFIICVSFNEKGDADGMLMAAIRFDLNCFPRQ